MDDTALQELVENHIIKDRIKQAFEALKHKIHDRELHKSFLGQWRAFSQNEQSYHVGVISYDQYSTYKKNIADEFIQLIALILEDRTTRSLQASEWMRAGQVAMKEGDFNVADDYFKQVLELIKDHIQATFERAVVALNQGQFQAALVGFNQVLATETDNHLALHNRGIVHLLLQQKTLACKDWRRVKSLGFIISNSALEIHCSETA